ncbi:MAG: DNA topoisomerase VI subunit B [Candidatus Micrarchaeota archaeon]|nr:DNA topoisomerase VI subunit B [Candidatus Micrarchaeota archaeon]
MVDTIAAEEIFKELKQHSISEFFRKNSQMLGYSGKVRSLTTVVHEYVTNSLDACEEAGILPEITVEVKELSESRHSIRNTDNGPGIPSKIIGKVLATVLSGTKFHRYIQQRGQQGIGGSGCTLFSQITTGKPIHLRSSTGRNAYECDLTIDIKSNKPLITNMKEFEPSSFRGLSIYGEFGETKYENSDHGVYEYLRRTALSNPHATIRLVDPEGKETVFLRSVQEMPKRPKPTRPHPLGVTTNDLRDFAHLSASKKVSSFLTDTFSRMSQNKVEELKGIVANVDFDKDPHTLTWDEAEALVKGFKQVKWIAPDLDSLSTVGEKQIELAMKNILNPKFMSVVERRPKVFRGGIPFVVEVGIAYGGNSGRQTEEGVKGTIIRFANKVPLLFDGSACAITEAASSIQWKRYHIKSFDEEPITLLVNVSSVYVPYSGVGKQAVAQEPEIIEEVKLAVMDCGRILQRYISGEKNLSIQTSKYNTIMRYVSQLAINLNDITGISKEEIEKALRAVIEKRYKHMLEEEKKLQEAAASIETAEQPSAEGENAAEEDSEAE